MENLIDSFSKKKEKLITFFFCITLAFICITINSKNSFLYLLQDCDDAQCFMTVARCMRRGDVLYKDVYEHKGIILYVIYLIANIISPDSFLGVYIIELLAFSVFIYFLVKTLRLFCSFDPINFFFVVLIAVRATTTVYFRAGGQCEEFVLPLFAVSVYLALKQCLNVKTEDLSKYSVIIGLCFSIVFWMKYTLTGMYIGLVIGVLVVGIKNRNSKYVIKNWLYFALGAVLGTIPVIAYFMINNALGDLWEVYFYTMIFKYGGKRSIGAHNTLRQMIALIKRIDILIPMLIMLIVPQKLHKSEWKSVCILIHIFALLGNAFGALQLYSFECFYAFAIFGYIGLVVLLKYLSEKETLNRAIRKEKKKIFDNSIIRFNKNVDQWKEEFHGSLLPKLRKKLNIVILIIVSVVFVSFLAWLPSPFRLYMGYGEEDYPLYQMKTCMEDMGVNKPNILYFDCTDMGLFNLTGTYPMDKYFCAYTLYSPEDLDYYNKYIINGAADFVVSTIPQKKLENYSYVNVYTEKETLFVSDGDLWDYFMYARKDLVKDAE